MLFGDEVLSPDRIDELDALGEAEASKREIAMAQQLIDSLSAEFDPSKFKDDYRERVLELIEKKAAGEEIAVQPEAEDTEPAPDLMAALEASLAEVRSGSSDEVAEPKKRAPAKPRSGSGKSTSKSKSDESGSRSRPRAKSKS
jgi:DNA end-binding protein Ku